MPTLTDPGGVEESRIPALDGVRALAVTGVIASHSGLMQLGWLGVDVFFGLSGYLITGILLNAKDARPSARQFFVPFYMRRALRILPLAWTLVVLVCAWRGQWQGIGWYLSYLVNWLPVTPPPRDLGLFWSLAVEEQFYMLWPAVVFFGSRRSVQNAALGLILVDILLRFVLSFWPPGFATAQWLDLATFARADSLAVGALLALRQKEPGFGREARWALPVLVVAGLGTLALRTLERHGFMPLLTYNLKWPLIAALVGAVLLWVLVHPPRALSNRWLAWLGKVSYGIYLIHGIFGSWLHLRFTLGQAPLIFAIQFGLTVPLAALSWYLFESPILQNKRFWPMPRSRGPTPPGAVSADAGERAKPGLG